MSPGGGGGGSQLRGQSVFTCGPGLVPGKYAWVAGDRQVWTGSFDFGSKTYAVGESGDVLPLPEVNIANSFLFLNACLGSLFG